MLNSSTYGATVGARLTRRNGAKQDKTLNKNLVWVYSSRRMRLYVI